MYWFGRARLAPPDGHNADALAYDQLANPSPPLKPQMRHGKLLGMNRGDEIKDLWKEMGGTDEAWETWNKQPDKGEQATIRFVDKTKPTKCLNLRWPTWRVRPGSGKLSWPDGQLSSRYGATWPWTGARKSCRTVEKLYQRIKERNDIQLVTFNVDENRGIGAALPLGTSVQVSGNAGARLR